MGVQNFLVINFLIVSLIISEKHDNCGIRGEIMSVQVAPDICCGIYRRLLVQVFSVYPVREQLPSHIFKNSPVRCGIRPDQCPHEDFLCYLQEFIKVDLVAVECPNILSCQEFLEILILHDTKQALLVVSQFLVLDTVIVGHDDTPSGFPFGELTVLVTHTRHLLKAVTGFFYGNIVRFIIIGNAEHIHGKDPLFHEAFLLIKITEPDKDFRSKQRIVLYITRHGLDVFKELVGYFHIQLQFSAKEWVYEVPELFLVISIGRP